MEKTHLNAIFSFYPAIGLFFVKWADINSCFIWQYHISL